MNSVVVKSSTYIDFGVENNEKHPKFNAGDRAIISKYKNIVSILPWTFVIGKVKDDKIT